MEAQLKALHRKRGGIKHRITSLEKFHSNIHDVIDAVPPELADDIRSRLTAAQSILTEFNEIQATIEDICDENNLNKEYEDRDQFESSFHSVIGKLQQLLKRTDLRTAPNHGSVENILRIIPSVSNNLSSVKLPIISLPTFSGSCTEWLEFRETFESLIHENDTLASIQKFHYLRASLDGSAAKAIQKLTLSGSNYELAWDMLCNRYNNDDLLMYNHIKAIFELPSTNSSDSKSFRTISDELTRHISYLSQLGNYEKQRDAILLFIITSKFDKTTAKDWEEFISHGDHSLRSLDTYLNNKAEICEKLEQRNNEVQGQQSKFEKKHAFIAKETKCYLCKLNHALFKCPEFLKLTPQARYDKVKELKLCNNCLRLGHLSNECASSSCKVCNKKHNTLLHFNTEHSQTQVQNQAPLTQVSLTSQVHSGKSQPEVLLSTVQVAVFDDQGNKHNCRALLDSGAQSHFMTHTLMTKLGLKKINSNTSVVGIGNITSTIQHKCNVTIKSNYSNFQSEIQCVLIPRISDSIPSHKIDVRSLHIPYKLPLADPEFDEPADIELLLGAGLFWDILRNGKIQLSKKGPILQNTEFGWIISGNINVPIKSMVHCNFAKVEHIEKQLEQIWELEQCKFEQNAFTSQELECEDMFQRTVSRNSNGRFMVEIPFKDNPNTLGNSQHTALKRFNHLESKLMANLQLKTQYCNFMNEYKTLGHMTKLTKPIDDTLCFYFPHHAVLKAESLTTKCRVVFDGSAVTDSGVSLNQIQHVGPVVQQDLVSIVLRFRQHAFVFTADISKMYRQIEIVPEQRRYQRIFWRSDPNNELEVFELNTVTYGTASAPYLATRCLKQLAIENTEAQPLASEIIARDFYVDDLISGSNSIHQASMLCKQIADILMSGGFELHKWCSNNDQILSHISNTNQLSKCMDFGNKSETKLLGLQWAFNTDSLTYYIKGSNSKTNITKRSILSDIAQVFDPIGLLSPATIITKMILQRLWALKITWDEVIPEQLKIKWLQFRTTLTCLNSLSIPRCAFSTSAVHVELHGFCDASQEAYGACIYVRCIDQGNNIQTRLLYAKGKVAPLKVLTIPRLELCGALLLAKLMQKVKSSITLKTNCHYWSDSQVVLCWIKLESRSLQTFVSNRVAEIQRLTNINDWTHIGTEHNPADVISRGMQPNELINAKLWWNGPSWLAQSRDLWPQSKNISIPKANIPETKNHYHNFTIQTLGESILERFSTLNKLQRVTAMCLRFIKNCKVQGKNRQVDVISVAELQIATQCLIKIAQRTNFYEEISILRNQKQLQKRSKLMNLSPFLDDLGIIRVGGRLQNAHLSYDQAHPIVLSAKSKLAELIFIHEHKQLCHAGPQLLVYTVREKYWILGGRNLARKIVHGCITCFKARPRNLQPQMGNLPLQRVQSAHPFSHVGTDYAGPFFIREKRGRGTKRFKCYLCLFVCMATKAVHLEAVTDLTTDSFLGLLRRFTARRGCPSIIYSDNGKTYVGAHSELNELGKFIQTSEKHLSSHAASKGINWSFIPAYAPNFGGLWESGVKSVKHHLKRVVANASLTLEDFITIITEIEGILNSRPLSPLSSEPNDLQPLTPAHFLIGRPITSTLEPDLLQFKPGRLSRYQLLTQIKQHFWNRWYKEYIGGLQARTKWTKQTDNIKLNCLVLIKDDNLPPMCWKLGRIIQLHPGPDGIVRVVSIQTAAGITKRSCARVCPLPIEVE